MRKTVRMMSVFVLLLGMSLLTVCCSDDEAKWKVGIALSDYDSIERWAVDGANMQRMLEHYGFEVDLQHVDRDINQQISQIESMIDGGCQVILVTAVDGTKLDDVLQRAYAAGIWVIAYDRLLMGTGAVDYYVTFNNLLVGVQQGQYIVNHLPTTTDIKNMELFTGPADDNNVNSYFTGAEGTLNIGGNLRVPSGENTMEECGITDWRTDVAKSRMERLIREQGYAPQGGTRLDAVLCSNDGLAEGVIAALEEAGFSAADMPIITGQDAEVGAVKRIIAGTQSMTVFKDTRLSAEAAVDLVRAIHAGTNGSFNFDGTSHNGVKSVKTIFCETVSVDKENYHQVLVESGYYTEQELK